jgi:hypothetical protein
MGKKITFFLVGSNQVFGRLNRGSKNLKNAVKTAKSENLAVRKRTQHQQSCLPKPGCNPL